MNCNELANRIEEFSLARDLPREVLEHVSICDSCNGLLESARVIGVLLANEPRVTAPEFLKARVLASIKEIDEEQRAASMSAIWKYLCGAAAAACVVFAMMSFSGGDMPQTSVPVQLQSYSGQCDNMSNTGSNPFVSEIIGE